MTNEADKVFNVLMAAFSVLSDEEIENFRWHLRMETPVLCGSQGHFYTDGIGGG